MGRYTEALTLTDLLISLVMVPCGTMTNEDMIAKAMQVVDCVKRVWIELGMSTKKIKLHGRGSG